MSLALDRVAITLGGRLLVANVSLELHPGEVVGLLGPNGAGKTTLLKLITGQIRPTTGRVRVFGLDPFANPAVSAQLGYCPEIDHFYEEMTGRAFVTLLATMNGYRGAELHDRVARAIETVGMTDRCDRRLGGYSKGMRQRIKVAQALVHDPRLVVLDEPLNGLDPVGRREMVGWMQAWAAQGKCVLVSSHILYEVEQITDRIVVMYKGRLLAQGDIAGIRDLMDSHPHRVEFTVDRPRELAATLIASDTVLGARLDPDRPNWMSVETSQPDRFYARLPELVLGGGFAVERLHAPDNNLEAVFRYLVQER